MTPAIDRRVARTLESSKMFRIPRVNVIASDEGFSVEVLGRAGLRYEEGDKTVVVDSEVLAVGPYTMVIYPARLTHWGPPHADDEIDAHARQKILDRIRDAFRFRGFEIKVYGQPEPDSH
jgi:hypothetical protein